MPRSNRSPIVIVLGLLCTLGAATPADATALGRQVAAAAGGWTAGGG